MLEARLSWRSGSYVAEKMLYIVCKCYICEAVVIGHGGAGAFIPEGRRVYK